MAKGEGGVARMTTKLTTYYIVKDIIQVYFYGEKCLFSDQKSYRGFESLPLRQLYRTSDPAEAPASKT